MVLSVLGSVVACAPPEQGDIPAGATAVASPALSVAASAAASSRPVTAASPRPGGAALVQDVSVVGGGRPAYLVLPADAEPGKAAGILWFHWLEYGAPNSNRTEFLEEANALAERGVVSVLVDGTFPWHEDPESISHDTAALQSDLDMVRAAYELLLSRPEVDRSRTALVGHDFGAMYESVIFADDDRPLGLAMMAPTARWADWFYRYWQISDDEAAYSAALKQYDPVEVLPQAGNRPILLQFANDDRFVPQEVAQSIADAAGDPGDHRTYDGTHELTEEARVERDAWLADLLHLEGDR